MPLFRSSSPGVPTRNDLRLTGVTATPVMTADSTSLSTVYLTPFRGSVISLYNGASWDPIATAEVSLAVTGRTTDLPFDIFAYNNAGVVTLEFLNWTDATNRATGLTRQDGVWTKTGDATRRYVGTIRARSATTYHWVQSGVDLPVKFDLFNADNRVDLPFTLTATTDTWNYTTATWRQAQASANYQIDVMVGLQEEAIDILLLSSSRNSTISVDRFVGIGFDSTTVPSGVTPRASNTVANTNMSQIARLTHRPTIGRHLYSWMEQSLATGTCTFVGDNGSASREQSGMSGLWVA